MLAAPALAQVTPRTNYEELQKEAKADRSVRIALGATDRSTEALLRDDARYAALILKQPGAQPGMRVLDVGSGGGYLALLLSSMVGEKGHVDIHNTYNWINQFPSMDPEVEKRFEGARLCLEETAGLFGLLTSKMKESDPRGDEAGWRDQYTMASERDVHAAVIGAAPVKSESMVEHAAANTELFESMPPVAVGSDANQTGSSAPVSADLGANVDLF